MPAAYIDFPSSDPATIATPDTGRVRIFADSTNSNLPSYKDDAGAVHVFSAFGGTASGDLGGSFPAPDVLKVHGNSVPSGVALGDLLYGSGANAFAKLAGQTTATRKFLRQTGTGSASAAPVWDTIVESDIGASTNDAGNSGTAITIDWSLGRAQKVTLTGNATITHSNMIAGLPYTLEVHTGAGSFTATFASTNWTGGSAPTVTTTASKQDTFTFYKSIAGTIQGAVYGQSYTP